MGNSGWRVTIGDQILVFDDISRGRFDDREALRAAKHVTVFASHAHGDHFDSGILERYACYENACFVLSDDITAQANWPLERIAFLREGENSLLGDLAIHAHGSTDEGVSFDVTVGGEGDALRLFHAGDLNDWHWLEENDPAWTASQAEAFARILGGIPADPAIDVAFFPVDPRMGRDHERGALQFTKALRPRAFVPMHFGAHFVPPQGFCERMAPWTRVICPGEAGETIAVSR